MNVMLPRALFIAASIAAFGVAANAQDANEPNLTIKRDEVIPKCPAKISVDSPRLCLRGNVLYRLYIPAGNPWWYGPCFAGGEACVELRYFGL